MGNTMYAADLHRMLTDVRPFASTDRILPSICQVRIESNDSSILASATDRFTLGISRTDYSGEGFAVNIATSNIDNIIRLSKTPRAMRESRTVEILLVGSGTAQSVKFIYSTGEELSALTETTDFPKFRQLLPEESIDEKAQGRVAVTYDAARLAKFAKVSGSEHMNVISRGRDGEVGKPTIVTIGDHFIGLIMPSRKDSMPTYSKPTWINL